ncbi:MAG: sigma-E factor regulatory protein RseB domain-containing protein [Acidobacteriota bacterium]
MGRGFCGKVYPLVLAGMWFFLPCGPPPAAASLGQEILVGPGTLEMPSILDGGSEENPLTSHLEVSRGWLVAPPDSHHLEDFLHLLATLRRAHHRVALSVRAGDGEGGAARPADPEHLEDWLAFLRRLAGQVGPEVVAIEPLVFSGPEADADRDAFMLKQAAVTLRAVRETIQVMVGLDDSREAIRWLDQLYENEVEPYVDRLAWHLPEGGNIPEPERVEAMQAVRLRLDPRATLWVFGLPADGQGDGSAPALYGRLAMAGVEGITFRASQAEKAWLEAFHGRITAAFVPTSSGKISFRDSHGVPLESISAWRFFNAKEALVEVILVPKDSAPDRFQVVLDTFDVSSPALFDPAKGTDRFLAGVVADPAANRATLAVSGVQGPVLLEYKRFVAARFSSEELEVGARRTPTVEEILARHQEARAASDALVKSVTADALIEFHYTVAGSGATFDVAYRSRYFWNRTDGAEFEQLEMLINGSRWNRKKFPQLPLIQPEKVVLPPLTITMGRQYVYRLKGRDRVGGRPAWRIDFTPTQKEAARYAGTAWIDQETYRLLKLSVVQTGLEAPVLSSEETDFFQEFPLPGGGRANLVGHVKGQQNWNTAGINLVVSRETRFENVRINAPEFDAERGEAHASDHQILSDTDQGLRYLVKDDQGHRVVQEHPDTRSRFALAGVFYNEALDFPIPFIGLNWFDYDFRKKGQQVNLFIAGAANFLTWADPDIGGTRLDTAVNLNLIGFATKDRFFVAGDEREGLEVKGRQQSFSASLGLPVGEFLKLRGIFGLAFNNYQLGEDTAPGFVVPEDTFTSSLGGEVQFNRRGFTATGEGGFFRRSNWKLWGDPNPASDAVGSRQIDFSRRFREYTRWSVSVDQDLFFKAFQKVRLGATWLDGADLDRFSSYQFSFFNERNRVRGFSGSGIRFDRGGLLKARYTFNLADQITFDAGLDYARVVDEATDTGYQSHAGFGVAGKFLGPWGLIVQVDYGVALHSDVPAVEGEQEFEILLLKIF